MAISRAVVIVIVVFAVLAVAIFALVLALALGLGLGLGLNRCVAPSILQVLPLLCAKNTAAFSIQVAQLQAFGNTIFPNVSVASGSQFVYAQVWNAAACKTGACSELNVSVPFEQFVFASGALALFNLTVRQTGEKCQSSVSPAVLVVAAKPPLIQTILPNAICTSATSATSIVISGGQFLKINDSLPVVKLGSFNVPLVESNLGNCAALTVPGFAKLEQCNTITLSIANTTFTQTTLNIPVTISNPLADNCGTIQSAVFAALPAPTLNRTNPTNLCSDLSGTKKLLVHGSSFTNAAMVSLVQGTSVLNALSTIFVASDTLEATFASNIQPGNYQVQVSSVPGCQTSTVSLTVFPIVLVLFAAPSAVYNGISTQVTLFTTGYGADFASVSLSIVNGNVTTIVQNLNFTVLAADKLSVIVPKGVQPGAYSLTVFSSKQCLASTLDPLQVTNDASVAMASVDPAFAWFNEATSVLISAQTVLPPSGKDFKNPPLVYLNPINPLLSPILLRAIVLVNSKLISAIIPKGLANGTYDLIVVNPDATVGILQRSVAITMDPPPKISAVQPDALVSGSSANDVNIIGTNFQANSAVALQCQTPTSQSIVINGTVQSISSTLVQARFTPTGVPDYSVCLVTIQSPSGNSFRYSAVTTKGPSANIRAWTSSSFSMTSARRAPATIIGKPTLSSRFAFAIGGDSGTTTGVMNTIESSSVDAFGNMQIWTIQRNNLPIALSFHSTVRIGAMIYVFGGNNNGQVQNKIYRAEILNPLNTPDTNINIDYNSSSSTGMGPGLWIYRVAALFDNAHPANSNGESLPGELVTFSLPKLNGLSVTLSWDAIPLASGYRIYRTSQANMTVSDLRLLDVVVGANNRQYTDSGKSNANVSIALNNIPLAPGSLGVWSQLPSNNMTLFREAFAVTSVSSHVNSNLNFVYAFGGRNQAGTYLNSYEILNITITAPVTAKGSEQHTLSAWRIGKFTLASAVAEMGASTMTYSDYNYIPNGRSWVWVGPGRTGVASFTRQLQTGLIASDGDFTSLSVASSIQNDGSGNCFQQGAGFLYVFTGKGGVADNTCTSASLCPDERGACNGAAKPPTLDKNWNNAGISTVENRVFSGCTQESAFFFLLGGSNGPTASATVEQTLK